MPSTFPLQRVVIIQTDLRGGLLYNDLTTFRGSICEQTDLRKMTCIFLKGYFEDSYTSIQMKCQGGVIFVHAPRLFYYPKRRIGYARCSLTGNKNYPAITKPANTMKGYATSWHAVWPTKHCTWLAIYPVYVQRRLMNG